MKKTNKEIKDQLKLWLEEADENQLQRIYFSLFPCQHKERKKRNNSLICNDCGHSLGWWCEKSPDNGCHYYSQKEGTSFFVELLDGKKYKLESKYNNSFETEDSCIFCNLPDERK